MPKTRANSLSYDMKSIAIDNHCSTKTQNQYSKNITRFTVWCKDQGIKTISDINTAGKVETIQKYSNYLQEKYSPATQHTLLAPVCKGLQVKMDEITKPKRKVSSITRGRDPQKNIQGRQEAINAKYEKIVKFEQAVGIRRHELQTLRGKNLKNDESGYLCVEVVSGKGGKYQLQRIDEQDQAFVIEVMKSVKPEQKVFSYKEINEKINFHHMRAENAQQKYNEYITKLHNDPEYRNILKNELIARYKANNKTIKQTHVKKFMETLNNEKPYTLRGESKELALKNGKPIQYDRLALLAVSVFHLSHWRIDVTVINYMLV